MRWILLTFASSIPPRLRTVSIPLRLLISDFFGKRALLIWGDQDIAGGLLLEQTDDLTMPLNNLLVNSFPIR